MTNFRIGNGFDVHKFDDAANADGIKVCGVMIPHTHKLTGHSDGDVGIHAIVDAILGALAEGDIGEHFPPSDSRWKGADSAIFLDHCKHLLERKKAKIENIDVTIICESPKITPHKNAMRERIATILKIRTEQVSVKATTTEGLGFTGRKEGIAAMASVLISFKK